MNNLNTGIFGEVTINKYKTKKVGDSFILGDLVDTVVKSNKICNSLLARYYQASDADQWGVSMVGEMYISESYIPGPVGLLRSDNNAFLIPGILEDGIQRVWTPQVSPDLPYWLWKYRFNPDISRHQIP